MKILITGLTLHNNKGGPALALSLIDKLKDEFENAQYYLTVPNFGNNIELEKKWADYYGINDVFGSVGVKEMLYLNRIRRKEFELFFKNIDLVVDLNALSYMDLPNLTYKKNLIRNLSIFTIRYFSNKWNIPCIRWTQSYGPFSSYWTKLLVKKDLQVQENIFVRGRTSLDNMQKILKDKKINSFPDIAITLKKDETYYLDKLNNKRYITLSPSSVLYTIEGRKHIEAYQEIIEYILNLGYEIVIVPHNLMSISPTLNSCDLEVSKEILKGLNTQRIHLVEEDLDVYLLKGIIAKSELHIGARYHSVIASLSMAVPTIAMAWHEKYRDIMQMYTMEKYIKDSSIDIKKVFEYINELLNNKNEIKGLLEKRQLFLEDELLNNIKLFMENYNEM